MKYLPNKPADVVLINAAECEPYITADAVLIQNFADKLIRGIRYIMIATGAPKAQIAIKRTKQALIAHLNSKLAESKEISLLLLPDVYPAGWEKYIVERALNKLTTVFRARSAPLSTMWPRRLQFAMPLKKTNR